MILFKKIAYNCKHATYLIEKKQITQLSTRERFELKIHLAGCSVCRLFEKQSIFINKMVKQLVPPKYYLPRQLDRSFKDKIQNEINQYLGKRR